MAKLPQYYSIFVQNGYESLDIIREIQYESELIEIGIQLTQHIEMLMNAINKLKIKADSDGIELFDDDFEIIDHDDERNTNNQQINTKQAIYNSKENNNEQVEMNRHRLTIEGYDDNEYAL